MVKVLFRVVSAVLLLGTSIAVWADGFIIYSSWTTEVRARSEATRATTQLDVDSRVKPALVDGLTYYRVVVEVKSVEEGTEHIDLAIANGFEQAWYLPADDETWETDVELAQVQGEVSPAEQDATPPGTTSESDSPQETGAIAQASSSNEGDTAEDEEVSSVIPDTEETQMEVSEAEELPAETPEEVATLPGTVEDEATPSDVGEQEEPDTADEVVASGGGEDSDGILTLEDFAGIDQITVEQTLLEVEEIQKQAQAMISDWAPREDEIVYDPRLTGDSGESSSDPESTGKTQQSGFNVLRIPDRRRR